MSTAPTLFVVDDDPATRDSLHFLAESVHLPIESFSSAEEFLARCDRSWQGCLLLDIRMPGMSGLELQEKLPEHGIQLPVIIVTAHGDVTTVMRALRNGAVDFLEKPVHEQGLLEKVRQAFAKDAERRSRRDGREDIERRLATLTPRERQVFSLIAEGESGKGIAARLGSSPNTIQNQRASIMRKMRASNVGQLVKMYMEAFPQGE